MVDQVQLFGTWASPFSGRVEIALKLKGVEYEYTEEDLSNKSPLLLHHNPVHKKVPVLVHNGNPISESLIILEFIDETWKHNPILPEHPQERAQARFWAQFIDQKCGSALTKAYVCGDEEREKAIGEVCELLKTLENELGDEKFFGGDKIGLVDIAANFIAMGFWLEAINEEVLGVELYTEKRLPRLYKWSEDYTNCSVIKENLPPRDKLLAFIRDRFRV